MKDITFTITVTNDERDIDDVIKMALEYIIFLLNGAEGETKEYKKKLELFDSVVVKDSNTNEVLKELKQNEV